MRGRRHIDAERSAIVMFGAAAFLVMALMLLGGGFLIGLGFRLAWAV